MRLPFGRRRFAARAANGGRFCLAAVGRAVLLGGSLLSNPCNKTCLQIIALTNNVFDRAVGNKRNDGGICYD